jgi:hypothetical protein
MRQNIRLVGIFSIVFLWSGNVMAFTISDCEVTASGVFSTGEMFDGNASDDTGVQSIDWTHSVSIGGTDFVFEIMAANPDGGINDGIVCRKNGQVSAIFQGAGMATVNGVGGYSFQIDIADNRPAPDSVVLAASISRTPVRRIEGIANFDPPRLIVVPSEINVVVGGSGSGKIKLHLDDIICRYSGTGTTYAFVRCTDPLESAYVAGDSFAISNARLRIQQADRSFDLTSVEVDLGTGPAPGTPDTYLLIISGPDGFFYPFSGNVIDGDIEIILLDL